MYSSERGTQPPDLSMRRIWTASEGSRLAYLRLSSEYSRSEPRQMRMLTVVS